MNQLVELKRVPHIMNHCVDGPKRLQRCQQCGRLLVVTIEKQFGYSSRMVRIAASTMAGSWTTHLFKSFGGSDS